MFDHNSYKKKRYDERKIKLLKMYGEKCNECGSNKNLEFHHVDPKTKLFDVTTSLGSRSWKVIENEVKKCKLICKNCHQLENIIQAGNQTAFGTHGTLSSYRWCKCLECKKAMSDWLKKYNKERKLKDPNFRKNRKKKITQVDPSS